MTQGKDEIIKRIIKDAKDAASSVLEQTGKDAEEITERARIESDLIGKESAEKALKLRENILQQEENAALLEVKKIVLKRKQEMVKSAYDSAISLIKKDNKAYRKLLESMLANVGTSGVVTFSITDKDFAKTLLQDYNKKHKTEFTLSATFGSFSGGIIVEGKDVDLDMTLEAEIALLRDETEPEVARMIFGANND